MPRIGVIAAGVGLAIALGAVPLVGAIAGWQAVLPLLGIVIGAIGATAPSYLKDHFATKRKIRVASLLLRDDFHRFQDAMHRSLNAGCWEGDPEPRLANEEHIALVAEGLTTWDDWQPITAALAARQYVLDLKRSGREVDECHDRIWKAFDAIDRARPKLQKIDDGSKAVSHGQRETVWALTGNPGQPPRP